MNKKYKFHIIYVCPMVYYCVETDEYLSDDLDIFVHLASDNDYKKYYGQEKYSKWVDKYVKIIDLKYIEDGRL